MDQSRADHINALLIQAWFWQAGIGTGPLPDLSDVTVPEAVLATSMIAARNDVLSQIGAIGELQYVVAGFMIRPLVESTRAAWDASAALSRIVADHARKDART